MLPFILFVCISSNQLASLSFINEDSCDLIEVTSMEDISTTSLAAGSAPTVLAAHTNVFLI